jgi:hypothetical protein
MDAIFNSLPRNLSLHVVDVGGMLGDCCLWTAHRAVGLESRTGVQRLLRCTTFEEDSLWAALAQATMRVNRLSDSNVVRKMGVAAEAGPDTLDGLLAPRSDAGADIIHDSIGEELGIKYAKP